MLPLSVFGGQNAFASFLDNQISTVVVLRALEVCREAKYYIYIDSDSLERNLSFLRKWLNPCNSLASLAIAKQLKKDKL